MWRAVPPYRLGPGRAGGNRRGERRIITGPGVQWRIAPPSSKPGHTSTGRPTPGRAGLRPSPRDASPCGAYARRRAGPGAGGHGWRCSRAPSRPAQTVATIQRQENPPWCWIPPCLSASPPGSRGAWLQEGAQELIREKALRGLRHHQLPRGEHRGPDGGVVSSGEINSTGRERAEDAGFPRAGGDVMKPAWGPPCKVLAEATSSLRWNGAPSTLRGVGGSRTTTRSWVSNTAAPFYYYPGWWEPGIPEMVFQVNQAAWDALPATSRRSSSTAPARCRPTLVQSTTRLKRPRPQDLSESEDPVRRFPTTFNGLRPGRRPTDTPERARLGHLRVTAGGTISGRTSGTVPFRLVQAPTSGLQKLHPYGGIRQG